MPANIGSFSIETLLFVLLAIGFVLGLIPAAIAFKKGYNHFQYWLLGFLVFYGGSFIGNITIGWYLGVILYAIILIISLTLKVNEKSIAQEDKHKSQIIKPLIVTVIIAIVLIIITVFSQYASNEASKAVEQISQSYLKNRG